MLNANLEPGRRARIELDQADGQDQRPVWVQGHGFDVDHHGLIKTWSSFLPVLPIGKPTDKDMGEVIKL